MDEETTLAGLIRQYRGEADQLAKESQSLHDDQQADVAVSFELQRQIAGAAALASQHQIAQEHAARLAAIHHRLHDQLIGLHRDALEQ